MKTRALISEHIIVSCIMLVALLAFMMIVNSFTAHIADDGQLINLAGSLRYRTYKLLLLQRDYQHANEASLKSISHSLLKNEIDDFDEIRHQIRGLSRASSIFPSQVKQNGITVIDEKWEQEVRPVLIAILEANAVDEQQQQHYLKISNEFVASINNYVGQLSMENRQVLERFGMVRWGFITFFTFLLLTIAYFTRNRLIRPLEALQKAADQLGAGNFQGTLPPAPPIKEVAALYQRFSEVSVSLQGMMDALASRSDSLLAFNRASNDMAQLTALEQIYRFICTRAAEILKVELVWVGLIEKGHHDIIPTASAGPCQDLMSQVRITWDDSELGQGPSGRAIKGMCPVKVTLDSPALAPWREKFEQLQLQYFISIPLLVREECIGVLTMASSSPQLHENYVVDICQVYANHAAAVIEDLKLTEYIIFSLARAAEANDEDTGNHILRVGEYCSVLALELGLPAATVYALRLQATLHDVGKIHVSPAILKKNGSLTDEEWLEMKLHPRYGSKIIGDHPMLMLAKEIALAHHERWDGGGYPFGLKGDEIPLVARIMNIADQYDALRSKRVYKPAFDHAKTCSIILEGDGRTKPEHFDPEVLAAFKNTTAAFEQIYERLK